MIGGAGPLSLVLRPGLRSLSDLAYSATRVLVLVASVVMVVVVFAQVVFRYVFNHALPWPEELAIFLFIWLTFLGASAATRDRTDPRVTAFLRLLPPRWAGGLELFADALTFGFAVFLAVTGADLAIRVVGQVSSAMQVSMALVYAAVPVGMTFTAIHVLRRLVVDVSTRARVVAVALLVGIPAAYLVFVAAPHVNAYLLVAALMLVLMAMGAPIGMAIGLATLATMMTHHPELPAIIASQRLVLGLFSYVLIAVPFFIVAGDLMMASGIGTQLIDLASALVGWVRGGLAQTCIVASALFANISGSGIADTAAVGSVMIPGMVKRGYRPAFAAALQASAGSLGVLFPPSIPAVLYAWVSGTSIAALFIAGFLPGLFVALSFSLWAYFVARREGHPKEPAPTRRTVGPVLGRAVPALVAPLIIVGGILTGIVTATESSVLAIVYTLVLGLVVQRTLTLRSLPAFFMRAGIDTARVLWVMGAATFLGYLLTIERLGESFNEAVLGISRDPFVVLLLINAFMLVIHMFMETAPSILVFVPVFMPVIGQLGVDPVYFGILMVVNSMLGTILPPVAVGLFVTSAISGETLERVSRAAIPFLVVMTVDLLLLIAFPVITTLLPTLFGYK